MEQEIWVAGFPSFYGGADTELDHLIDLFRAHDRAVHLVPMFGADPSMVESVTKRGCVIHEYRDDIFREKLVISFCNGQFLKCLPAIMAVGPPALVVWFNCMTWLFEAEKHAHAMGWIDYFGFVSGYQRKCIAPQLEVIRPVRTFAYLPYFNTGRVEWRYRQWNGTYSLGRISRDDEDRFASDTWRIYDRVVVPNALKKKVYILGYGSNAARKTGEPPPGLDWQTWEPNGIPATDFFRLIDTMVHKTGGSRESYCRVLVEAYAHGAVPIVEDSYAFPELVIHGETGFMAAESDEFSYYASLLAMNPSEHRRIAANGREFLEKKLVDEEACWQGWKDGPLALGPV